MIHSSSVPLLAHDRPLSHSNLRAFAHADLFTSTCTHHLWLLMGLAPPHLSKDVGIVAEIHLTPVPQWFPPFFLHPIVLFHSLHRLLVEFIFLRHGIDGILLLKS